MRPKKPSTPKPVIFISGFPASELRDPNNRTVFPPTPGTLLDATRKKAFFDAMLDILRDLVAGPSIRSVFGIAKQAQSFYVILDSFGSTSADYVMGWGGPTWPSAVLVKQDVVFVQPGKADLPEAVASALASGNEL